MSIPQKMLMIHPTMMTAVSIWIRAAATLSQNTQHTPRSEISSLRAPHSTVNADTKVPVRQNQQNILSTKVKTAQLIEKYVLLTALVWYVAITIHPCFWLHDVFSPTWWTVFNSRFQWNTPDSGLQNFQWNKQDETCAFIYWRHSAVLFTAVLWAKY